MLKMDKYRLIKTFFYLIHVYLIFQIVQEDNRIWNTLYLPIVFSAITSVLTYIIYTQSGNKSSQYLIYFLLTGSLSYFTAFGQSIENNIAIIVFAFSFPLTAWYFNKFIREILFNRRIIYRRKNKVEKLNLLLLLFVICLDFLTIFSVQLQDISRIFLVFYFCINIIIPLFIITYLLITTKQREQSFLLWMLVIPISALSPFIFLHVIPLLLNKLWIDAYITAWAFFIIPIGYTYLILAKKLLNLKFIFNRIIYYSGLSLIPSFCIALILIWISPLLSLVNLIKLFVILLLFNTIFLFIKEQIDYYFRDFLFQDKNNIVQSIEQLIEDLQDIMTLTDLNHFITLEIEKNLRMVDLTIVKYNTSTYQIEKEYLIGNTSFENIPYPQFSEHDNQALIEYQSSIGLLLSKQTDVITYLWIKKQKENLRFNISDKSWLIIFTSYVRLTYENILMNKKSASQIIGFNKKNSIPQPRLLFHISEAERRKLAEDIHDTILQDQIYLYRELDTLSNNNHSKLLTIKNELKQVIDKTRKICIEMRLDNLSNRGLTTSLNALFNELQLKAPFHLYYEVEIATERFNHNEKPIMIYRIVEEMINNAIKHSYANRVSINIWEMNEHIYIDYLDDGEGFNEKEAMDKGQIGLRSILERVKIMNGVIEFATDRPKKVQIFITIPR